MLIIARTTGDQTVYGNSKWNVNSRNCAILVISIATAEHEHPVPKQIESKQMEPTTPHNWRRITQQHAITQTITTYEQPLQISKKVW